MKPHETRPRAGMYLRKSSAPGDENRSLQLQEQTCRDIAAQEGYALIERPYKQIVSGYSLEADRSEFDRLLEDVQAGRLDVILTYRIDRLGRRVSETGRLMDLCQRQGVKIHHSHGITDPNDSAKSLTFTIMSAMAQNESASISERVRADRADRRFKSWLGGNVPYGFMPSKRDREGNKRLIAHPEESKVIRRAYELAVKDRRSATSVADALDGEGYRMRSGARWTMKRIQRVLLNPVVAGFAVGNLGGPRNRRDKYAEIIYRDGEPVMLHEQLLSVDEWEQATAAIGATRRKTQRAQRRSPFLSGLVFCGICGRKMVAGYASNKGRVNRRYICPGYAYPLASRCRNGMNNVHLESFVMDYARVTLKDPKFRAALDRRARKADDLTVTFELLERLDALKEAETALEDQLKDTLSPRTISSLTARLDEVNTESQQVAEDLQAARSERQVAYSVEDIYEAVISMDPKDQRYAVESVIEEIQVVPGPTMYHKGMMGGQTVDLSRIKIKRKYARKWDQLTEPTPAPIPSEIECGSCHRLIPRTEFVRLHKAECEAQSSSES